MKLTQTQQEFIVHWGEMGTWWGINRTVSQIFALLYLTPEPLNAETIAQTLSVARSNVSTSLRELQAWRLIHVTHRLGDRRDHFETITDVWALFSVVMEERKRREVDPTLIALRTWVEHSKKSEDTHTQKRLSDMLDFFETAAYWQEQVQRFSPETLKKLAKSGAKIQQALGLK